MDSAISTVTSPRRQMTKRPATRRWRLSPTCLVQGTVLGTVAVMLLLNLHVSTQHTSPHGASPSQNSPKTKARLEGWKLPPAMPPSAPEVVTAVVAAPSSPASRPPIHHNRSTARDEMIDYFGQAAPWRQSTTLPDWMKEYMAWHQQERARLTADNWETDARFLIVRCLEVDDTCGGTADRLKPLPFYLLVAHRMQRLLLFWWERPSSLDNFLLPPVDGLDWRIPDFMMQQVDRLRTNKRNLVGSRSIYSAIGFVDPARPDRPGGNRPPSNDTVVASLFFQAHHHGAYEYDAMRRQLPYWDVETNRTVTPMHVAETEDQVEATYVQVFRDLWSSTFVPVPAIQERIAAEMETLGLRRNAYLAIHIRARYHKPKQGQALVGMSNNALHCIYDLGLEHRGAAAGTLPVYVSSDHQSAVWETLVYGRRTLGIPNVMARQVEDLLRLNQTQAMAESSTLHLDRGVDALARRPHERTKHEAELYYDTFVDLYLLAQAACRVYNIGNYCKWANLLSDHPECMGNHARTSCSAPNTMNKPVG